MTALFIAAAVFALVAGLIVSIRAEDHRTAAFDDAPKRTQPGVRDQYATTGTLHRAPVPRFG